MSSLGVCIVQLDHGYGNYSVSTFKWKRGDTVELRLGGYTVQSDGTVLRYGNTINKVL